MTLARALHAEVLKMKRTMALKMVVLAPALIVVLVLFIASQAPHTMLHRTGPRHEWAELTRLTLQFWAALMMPLYITLETALMASLDHSENQWKSLLARPVPRWTLYGAKLMVATAMTAAATLALLCGILMDGAILPRIQSGVVFGFPAPWAAIFRDGAQVAGLAFLALAIQHWVSLRWRSFSVAVGAGIVAMVAGIFAYAAGQQGGGWPQYFPWALPMMVMGKEPRHIAAALWIGAAAGLAVTVAGCWDFCRREVQ